LILQLYTFVLKLSIQNGNVIDSEFKEKLFINLPFFVLRAVVPYPNSIQILFEPTREECLNLLLSIPRKIIKTVEDIPRVEQLLMESNNI
jgi:dynein heavy chain, axonemal